MPSSPPPLLPPFQGNDRARTEARRSATHSCPKNHAIPGEQEGRGCSRREAKSVEILYGFPVGKFPTDIPGGWGVDLCNGKFTYSTTVPSSVRISGSCCRA